jgi:hypothetical protein
MAYALVCRAAYKDVAKADLLPRQRIPLQWLAHWRHARYLMFEAVYMDVTAGRLVYRLVDGVLRHVIDIHVSERVSYTLTQCPTRCPSFELQLHEHIYSRGGLRINVGETWSSDETHLTPSVWTMRANFYYHMRHVPIDCVHCV